MTLKIRRRTFEVNETDRIIFNGAVYILITQKYFQDWGYMNPTLPKTTFTKLLKDGKIRKSDKKYKVMGYSGETIKLDMWEFVKEST